MSFSGVDREHKILELSIINESLQKDVIAKEREVKKLKQDLQQYEQTLHRIRDENNADVPKKDAEVMAGMCCTGAECGDLVPAQDLDQLLREEAGKYRERIRNMELSLQSSGAKLHAVHKLNLGLIEELDSLRRLIVAVDVERRDARVKLDLQRTIVKQMVRQLRQAKAQIRCECVTSTPDGTVEFPDETQISSIPPRAQSTAISDDELEEADVSLACECDEQPPAGNVHDQTTLKLDTPDHTEVHLNPTGNQTLESSTSYVTGNQLSSSNTPVNLNNNPLLDASPRNLSGNLQGDASRSLHESGNREFEPSKTLNENQRHVWSPNPPCSSKYIIPISSSSILETLHPGSSKRDLNISRNPTIESSPRHTPCDQSKCRNSEANIKEDYENLLVQSDLGKSRHSISESNSSKSTTGSSQSFKNRTKNPVINLNKHMSQSFDEPNPTRTTAQLEETLSELKNIRENMSITENDTHNTEGCQCKCLCKEKTSVLYSGHSLTENTSTAKENESCDDCQCKCDCEETTTSVKVNRSDNHLENIGSEYFSKESLRPSESEKNIQECQCICSCKEIKQNSKECLCICPCKETKNDDESTQRSILVLNASGKKDNICCSRSDESITSYWNGWLVTPEGILKGLQAMRQTLMGKSTEYTNISVNKSSENPPSTSINTNANTSSTQACKENSKSTKSYSGLDLHSQNRKKSVSIQLSQESNDCDYCNVAVDWQEDDKVGARHKRDQEDIPEMTDKRQSGNKFAMENVRAMQSSRTIRDSVELVDRLTGSLSDARTIRIKCDKSEVLQDSGGGSSCAGACERYYHDKLLATLQVLENKEQTILVQGSSLGVAEDRIAELTKRASDLRQQLDQKAQELNQLRQFADSCRADKSDVSVQEGEGRKQSTDSLQDNLADITELYRECFYEAAKQEELIDMLRKSYLDVRLVERLERDKTDKITRLQHVVNTQRRSIQQCQDVVMEVESLKSEISSFLNNSNNDSGMWERGSESPDVGEELADILDQLRQLQHILTTDCTCGLEEGNSLLKERNRTLESELEQARKRNSELDRSLRQILEQQYEKQLKQKEQELQEVVQKMEKLENTCRERAEAGEVLARQLQQAQVMLSDKTAELVEAQRASAAKDAIIRDLHHRLEHSERLVQEGLKKLSEVAQSRTELLLDSQGRITELEQRLKHAVRRSRELEAGCREQERSSSELRACLAEAHERGARLCDESRRVAAGVRRWMQDKRLQTREQQEKIKMQKLKIRELEQCVRWRQNIDLTSQSETEPCTSMSQCDVRTYPRCSKFRPMCRSETAPRDSLAGCVAAHARENETGSCSKCASNRQESGSEMASCSRAPVPPARKKKQSCDDLNCPSTSAGARDRSSPASHPDVRWTRLCSRLPRQVSTDEVLERVQHLHTALLDGQRRWRRHR